MERIKSRTKYIQDLEARNKAQAEQIQDLTKELEALSCTARGSQYRRLVAQGVMKVPRQEGEPERTIAENEPFWLIRKKDGVLLHVCIAEVVGRLMLTLDDGKAPG